MTLVQKRVASRDVRMVVAGFSERTGCFAGRSPVLALTARPGLMLEFYRAERYLVSRYEGAFSRTPPIALVGPMTTPFADLAMEGDVDTFTVHLQPTALSRLFRFPMPTLVDEASDALDALGPTLRTLGDRVFGARDFPAQVQEAEAWFRSMLVNVRAESAIDRAARLVARSRGRVTIGALASRTGLSVRQMQRRFIDEVGMAPKTYARLHRFKATLAARHASPHQTWTQIAYACGYADQAHLARDFRELSGRSPTGYADMSS